VLTSILYPVAVVLLLAAPLAATWAAHRAFQTMVGPQERYRKIWYLVVILQLFMIAWVWRHVNLSLPGLEVACIDSQAEKLSIREESRGEPDLTGSVVRLGLTGSRGLATCFLWNVAIEAQKKNQWNKLELVVRSLTKLQPHFIKPWLFQSWNLSYNVAVESDRPRDKYFFIARGISLLAEGEAQNRDHPDLRWSIGFYLQHKIMQSDQTNYLRSLLQLSMIPPHERDPARFWTQTSQGPTLNGAEFAAFVKQNPQLVRRLREGIRKETEQEKKQLFLARRPEDVVRFLDDNYSVPSLYNPRAIRADLPANVRGWQEQADVPDSKIDDERQRFPPLPPPAGKEPRLVTPFDERALTSSSALHDDDDGFTVSHAWFAYAQEPLPAPDDVLPGASKEITDRTRQRKPRNMTTLIFRNYPAQALRYHAERLQAEGWFDEEPWDTSGPREWARLPGAPLKVGGDQPWSQQAWERALQAWKEHGESNHVLFRDAAAEANTRQLATEFARRTGIEVGAPPPQLDTSRLDARGKDELRAARVLYEYNFYRGVTNFHHHYNRALVEAKPETVACRKLFAQADLYRVNGDVMEALRTYKTPIAQDPKKVPLWSDRKLNPMEAWRELVLLKNDEFRRDNLAQETSAEVQTRYLQLWNRLERADLSAKLSGATALPLVPRLDAEALNAPIIQGPFDFRYVKNDQGGWEVSTTGEGEPLIQDANWDQVMQRLRLPTRRGMEIQPLGAPQLGPKVTPGQAEKQ
jgi:hypothetical protein